MAYFEQPFVDSPNISAGYLRRLRAGVRKTKSLGTYRSDGFSSKMWILPNGKPVSITDLHYRWLQQNPEVALRFGLDLAALPNDDTTIRIAALNRGFVRVNYEINHGRLTIEANARHWTPRIKDAIFVVISGNLDAVDSMKVHLLNAKAFIVKSGCATLFNFKNREKLDHLPLISGSNRAKILLKTYRQRLAKKLG